MAKRWRRGKDSLWSLAVCATALIVLAGWGVYSAYYAHATPPSDPGLTDGMFYGPYHLNAYLLRFIRPVDIHGQSLAYRAMLLLALGLAGGMILWPRWLGMLNRRWLRWLLSLLSAAALISGAIWCAKGSAGRPQIAGLVMAVGLFLWGRFGWNRSVNRLLGFVVVIALIALFAPAPFVHVDHSPHSWTEMEIIQAHYAMLLGPGDRLAAGMRLFDDITPGYGILTPTLMASIERMVGHISLHGYTLLIDSFQAIYLAAMAYAVYIYGRRHWIMAVLGIGLVAIHYHFYQFFHSIGAPNHTAWRTIAAPLALLAIMACRRAAPASAALGLGFVAGVALLQCWDIGVAIGAGLVTYVSLLGLPSQSGRTWPRLAALLTRFALGGFLAVSSFFALFAFIFHQVPSIAGLRAFAHVMRVATASGYGGSRLTNLEPLACLMFVHALLVLFQVIAVAGRSPIGFFARFRACVAATILVWFAYFANRPDHEYLWSFFILYAFLLVDIVRVLIFAGRRGLWCWPVPAAVGALALVVVPYLTSAFPRQWDLYRKGIRLIIHPPDAKTAQRLEGIDLPNVPRAAEIVSKSHFIASLDQTRPIIYFTVDSYLVPKLSGVWPALPMAEPFWETTCRRQYDRLIQRVLGSGAEYIYFDSEASIARRPSPHEPSPVPPIPGECEYYRQLRRDLTPYFEKETKIAGWERWRRRSHALASVNRLRVVPIDHSRQ